MEFSVKPQLINSKKTGKQYQAYKLTIGDFEHIFFPVGRMEANYMRDIVGDGIVSEVK